MREKDDTIVPAGRWSPAKMTCDVFVRSRFRVTCANDDIDYGDDHIIIHAL